MWTGRSQVCAGSCGTVAKMLSPATGSYGGVSWKTQFAALLVKKSACVGDADVVPLGPAAAVVVVDGATVAAVALGSRLLSTTRSKVPSMSANRPGDESASGSAIFPSFSSFLSRELGPLRAAAAKSAVACGRDDSGSSGLRGLWGSLRADGPIGRRVLSDGRHTTPPCARLEWFPIGAALRIYKALELRSIVLRGRRCCGSNVFDVESYHCGCGSCEVNGKSEVA